MMLERCCILFVTLLTMSVDCHGAGRRNMRTSFESSQVRTQTVSNNNFAPYQSTDKVVNIDIVPDDVIDAIVIEQPVPDSSNDEPALTDAEITEIISDLNDIVAGLNTEINVLNSEIARCQKEKKTNTVLTVVGGAGVLGTGIGAIIQGKKIHDAKKAGAVEKQDGQDKKEASE